MRPSMVSIGGVGVSVDSAQVGLSESGDPVYSLFRKPACAHVETTTDLAVSVSAEPPPPESGPLRFDCDGGWAEYEDEGGYRVVVWAGPGEARLTARSNPDTSRVDVYAGESWARFFPRFDDEGRPAVGNPFRYPLDQLLLMNHLAVRGGLIVHSAGLEINGRALVFPGVSQAGKTTISNLLADAGMRDALLSDDRVIIRRDAGGGFQAWGTPWPGEARVARNAAVPLGALLFLVKADSPSLVPISSSAAAQRLFPVISSPWWDRGRLLGVLETCERLVGEIPCFELRFAPDARAVDLILRYAGGDSSAG